MKKGRPDGGRIPMQYLHESNLSSTTLKPIDRKGKRGSLTGFPTKSRICDVIQ